MLDLVDVSYYWSAWAGIVYMRHDTVAPWLARCERNHYFQVSAPDSNPSIIAEKVGIWFVKDIGNNEYVVYNAQIGNIYVFLIFTATTANPGIFVQIYKGKTGSTAPP